ncbi:MAG TPA: TonB-dependent receptor, partial [Bryobacteraceae bacterium]|nr:TonB-dependent receptor [Bryobacteraceae bacterium]
FSGEPFADFLLGLPETTQRYTSAVPVFQRRFSELGFFFQDDSKASSRLTLNLGIRYDYISPRREINGAYMNFNPVDGSLVFPDEKSISMVHPAFPTSIKRVTAAQAGFPSMLMNGTNSISPRIGFAYRLTDNPSTVLRGSYGIFTANAGWKNNNFATLQSGAFALTETFTNVITNGVPLVTLDHPFPSTIGAGPSTVSVGGNSPNLGIPYLQQWNLTLERQIYGDWAVHVSYVGAKNTQLSYRHNINQPRASLTPFDPSRLIYPGYLTITYAEPGGNSSYPAMQFGFNHRLSSGLMVEGLFQWINEITDVGEDGIDVWLGPTIENAYCRSCERGKGLGDSLDFRTNLVYEIPFGKGRPFGSSVRPVVNGFIGGWSIGAIVDARNGRPATVLYSGVDASNTNLFGGRASYVAGCDPRTGDGKSAPYLNINCFAVPAAGTFGNVGTTPFRKPGSYDVSGSIYKYFPLWREGVRLRVNGVFTNAFNHPTWNDVGNNITVPATFGKFVSQQSFGRWVGSRTINLQAQIQW